MNRRFRRSLARALRFGSGRIAGRTPRRIRSMLRDRKGVGAVEFAFVAPLLVLMYIGAVEISVALSVDTKVSRAGNITLDLITQGTTITKSDMADLVDVAEAILAPFDGSNIVLTFTGIRVDASTNAKVDWSWKSDNTTPYPKNTTITIQDFPMLDSVPSATGTLAVFSQQTLFWPIVRRDIKPHIVEMRRQPS